MSRRVSSGRKRGRPAGMTAPRTQIAVRFPDELLAKVDAYLERQRAELPGVTLTRADAIRMLVSKALQ